MNCRPLLALLCLLSPTACQEKSSTEPPPLPSSAPATSAPAAAATTAAPAPPAAPAPAAAAATGDIPTSEDYEQQAIDQINPQNMAAELDKLEKDIGP